MTTEVPTEDITKLVEMAEGAFENTALIIVDVQNDFCPGGALAVPEGDRVIVPINMLSTIMNMEGCPIVYTRDWHPEDHVSFKEQGGPWPPHCVQYSEGAEYHPDLEVFEDGIEVLKATGSKEEAYSGFDGTRLAGRLKDLGIEGVIIVGLATDYCVKATALDAIHAGFKTGVFTPGCAGVNVNEGDSAQALKEMEDAGVMIV